MSSFAKAVGVAITVAGPVPIPPVGNAGPAYKSFPAVARLGSRDLVVAGGQREDEKGPRTDSTRLFM